MSTTQTRERPRDTARLLQPNTRRYPRYTAGFSFRDVAGCCKDETKPAALLIVSGFVVGGYPAVGWPCYMGDNISRSGRLVGRDP